jgi:hypothetical protein
MMENGQQYTFAMKLSKTWGLVSWELWTEQTDSYLFAFSGGGWGGRLRPLVKGIRSMAVGHYSTAGGFCARAPTSLPDMLRIRKEATVTCLERCLQ